MFYRAFWEWASVSKYGEAEPENASLGFVPVIALPFLFPVEE
jgi:hypothetical protein